ncbi:HNH endonuclease [Armatimonas sp.]|uniref:HNH endonuclease n=1 Tax=Armatimonas sp. TaxID=1872638 RepID=UPI0037528906
MMEALRAQIIARAGNRCEYCRAPGYIGTQRLSIEHIRPRAAGGTDDPFNLAVACQGCNNHKYTKITVLDPLTGTRVALFHPRQQVWEEHFSWSEDALEVIGQTPTGRATVAALQLNREELVRFRRVLIPAGEHPPIPAPTP